MKTRTPARDLRDFGLITGAITAVLFGVLMPWARSRPYPLWPWVVGAILSLWALAAPSTLGPVHRVWMTLGHLLGWINTRILLSAVFYLVMAPLGLVMGRVRRDPLRRGFDSTLGTYRVPTPIRSNKHLERPF